MNKRQAKRLAYRIASLLIDQRLTSPPSPDGGFALNDADEARIEVALRELSQQLFDRAGE